MYTEIQTLTRNARQFPLETAPVPLKNIKRHILDRHLNVLRILTGN